MDKPISIILEEAKQSIADAVNNANLHPALLEPIIKDLYTEVQYHAKMQYQKDKNEYEHAAGSTNNKQ